MTHIMWLEIDHLRSRSFALSSSGCTLSAPLTLSLDFTNKTATDSVWHIITNTDALAGMLGLLANGLHVAH